MSFNESAHNDELQPRRGDGTFAEKTGAAAEISLSDSSDAPSPSNGFLIPGTECDCDVDYPCPNHDTDAEAAYYAGVAPDPVRVRDAHSFDDAWDD